MKDQGNKNFLQLFYENYKKILNKNEINNQTNKADDILNKIKIIGSFLINIENYFLKNNNVDIILEIKLKFKEIFKEKDVYKLIDLINEVDSNHLENIQIEFFYIILEQFGNFITNDEFFECIYALINKISFSQFYIKAYLYKEKSFQEILNFLKLIDSSNLKKNFKIELTIDLIQRSSLRFIHSNSYKESYEILLFFISNYKDYLDDENLLIVQKSISNHLYNLLKNEKNEFFEQSLYLIEYFPENLKPSEIIFNKLLDNISKIKGNSYLCEFILKIMKKNNIKRSIITLNTILDIYCSDGEFDKAYDILKNYFVKENLKPDHFSYSIMIKGVKLSKNKSFDKAFEFLKLYKENNFDKDIIIYNSILDLAINKKKFYLTEKIFEEIITNEDIKPDQITFNTLIKGCYNEMNFEKAIEYKKLMIKNKILPNNITYNTIIDLAVKNKKLNEAFNLYNEMLKEGIKSDEFTHSIILNGLKISNSNPNMVKKALNNIKILIKDMKSGFDEIFFNTILDICTKYNFPDEMNYFYNIMKFKGIKESSITYGILMKGYGKFNHFDKAFDIFKLMKEKKKEINEITYGCILDACSKQGRMDIAEEILKEINIKNLKTNSIIYTTIIKGFINSKEYEKAHKFFEEIKDLVKIKGMVITYNCMLDLLVKQNKIKEAENLFAEIDSIFKADIISYSTLIKGLLKNNKIFRSIELVKKMNQNNFKLQQGLINLILDSCSNRNQCQTGINFFRYVNTTNYIPNEITFGIMIKIYGFSRNLSQAFNLLNIMETYKISPSIVIYTNLVHISFANKSLEKVKEAYELMKKNDIKGDNLFFTKLVDGFVKFKKYDTAFNYLKISVDKNFKIRKNVLENFKIIAKKLKKNQMIELLQELLKNESYNYKTPFKNIDLNKMENNTVKKNLNDQFNKYNDNIIFKRQRLMN